VTAFSRRRLIAVILFGAIIVCFALLTVLFTNGRTKLSPTFVAAVVQKWQHPPRPSHVIVVIEENKASDSIIGSTHAPYINELARDGAFFAHSSGVAHPSQPNYLALFAGVTNGDGDHCPQKTVPSSAPTLAGRLDSAGFSFGGYAEGMPAVGYLGCKADDQQHGYVRKHNPWVNFDDVPKSENLPLTSLPSSYDRLPTVSFIIPNLAHDMHDGSISTGDMWLRENVGPIVDWARKHGALVIITWDESDEQRTNHIPTIFIGDGVKPGRYDEPIDHYSVLRTIEDFYGLAPLGKSIFAAPVEDCWLPVRARDGAESPIARVAGFLRRGAGH